jgi:thymidylate synthase
MNTRKVISCCLTFFTLGVATIGTAQDKSQRDLSTYADGGSYELNYITRDTDAFKKTKEKVRNFIWEHWRRKRAAHIVLRDCAMYPEGCDDGTTYNFYIERGANGNWQITEEYDHLHAALPPVTTNDEHRRGVVIYSNVEKINAGDMDDCSESLSGTFELYPKTYRLRLIKSEATNGKSGKSCMVI